jgi:hypothetical protein
MLIVDQVDSEVADAQMQKYRRLDRWPITAKIAWIDDGGVASVMLEER